MCDLLDHGRLVRLQLLVAVPLEDRQERIVDAGRVPRELLEHGEAAERRVRGRVAALVAARRAVRPRGGRRRRAAPASDRGRPRCAASAARGSPRRSSRSRTRRCTRSGRCVVEHRDDDALEGRLERADARSGRQRHVDVRARAAPAAPVRPRHPSRAGSSSPGGARSCRRRDRPRTPSWVPLP